jgi:dihydroxyacetone kinase DhaKLM complex PTS-EIIA-like component DhaM
MINPLLRRAVIAACQPCNSTKGSKRLGLHDESEMRIRALVAAPLIEQLLAAAIAAETASRLRKKSPIDLTKLRIDK